MSDITSDADSTALARIVDELGKLSRKYEVQITISVNPHKIEPEADGDRDPNDDR